MKTLTLNHNGQKIVALTTVWYAHSLWQRLRGLIGRTPLQPGEGMLLNPCGSVHTIAMSYALDLVFMDKQGQVLKCVSALPPYRMAKARKARFTLELAQGAIERLGIKTGDTLSWEVVS